MQWGPEGGDVEGINIKWVRWFEERRGRKWVVGRVVMCVVRWRVLEGWLGLCGWGEEVRDMWRGRGVRWLFLKTFRSSKEVGRGVRIRESMVCHHDTCHVGRGCEGKSGALGEGFRVKKGGR